MFETVRSAEFPFPNHNPDVQNRFWSYLTQTDPEPWFHVAYSYPIMIDGDECVEQREGGVIFSHSIERVFDMRDNESVILDEIQLVCPPALNSMDTWRMLFIRKIYAGYVDDGEGHKGFILETDFGDQYVMTPRGYCSPGHKNLLNKELLYASK